MIAAKYALLAPWLDYELLSLSNYTDDIKAEIPARTQKARVEPRLLQVARLAVQRSKLATLQFGSKEVLEGGCYHFNVKMPSTQGRSVECSYTPVRISVTVAPTWLTLAAPRVARSGQAAGAQEAGL